MMERVQVIGRRKCQMSGADFGGKFMGISKETWVVTYLKLDENDDDIHCFQDLGEGPLPNELVNGELSPQVRGLEQFVYIVYCSKVPKPFRH